MRPPENCRFKKSIDQSRQTERRERRAQPIDTSWIRTAGLGNVPEQDGQNKSSERNIAEVVSEIKQGAKKRTGLMGLRLLALTLRLTPVTMRGTQRYYVEDGNLRWSAVRECKEGCSKSSWLGRGDTHFVPVGIDLRWKDLREKEQNSDHGQVTGPKPR